MPGTPADHPPGLEHWLAAGDLDLAYRLGTSLVADLQALDLVFYEPTTPDEQAFGLVGFALAAEARTEDASVQALAEDCSWVLAAARGGAGPVRVCDGTGGSTFEALWDLALGLGIWLCADPSIRAAADRVAERYWPEGGPPDDLDPAGGATAREYWWMGWGAEVPKDPDLRALLRAIPVEKHHSGVLSQLAELDKEALLLALKSEFAAAAGLRLRVGLAVRGLAAQGQPAAAGPRDHWKGKALALLVRHPEWTNRQIAREAGCHPVTLSRWPTFQKAREAQRTAKDDIPRGWRAGDGGVEARA